MTRSLQSKLIAGLLAGAVQFGVLGFAFADTTILNVSYDPTRELYKDFNDAFAAKWKADTGETVTIQQSHGGSGKQARAVIDGLDADVVTLALESDINAIVDNSKKINPDWRTRLPNNAAPYTSTIVFLVRTGNPKGIKDWGDLIKDGVEVITPNPKTSGGARWNYLAAWAWANGQFGGDEAKDKEFVANLFAHVPGARHRRARLDGDLRREGPGRRAARLGERGLSGARRVRRRQLRGGLPAAVDPGRAAGRGGRRQCRRQGHPQGRRGLSELPLFRGRPDASSPSTTTARRSPNWCRPTTSPKLPEIKLVTIDDPIFGGWKKAQPYHFGDGGVFDQIYKPAQ